MTVEHKLIVGFDDLKNIVLECRNADCATRVTMSPDRRAEVPERCPSCGDDWLRKDRRSDITIKSSVFLNVIENIAKLRMKDGAYSQPGFRILLEFDEPCVLTKP